MTVMADQAQSALRKITALRVRPRYRLDVRWDDGPSVIVDMEDLISEGNAFAPLRDPDLFAMARIGARRRTVEWPDPRNPADLIVDYCADALFLKGERQQYGTFLRRMLREFESMRRKLMHTEREPT